MNSLLLQSSRAGRIWKILLIALGVLALVFVVGWVFFLPGLVKRQLTSLSGFPADAARISVNPFTGSAHVEQFELRNPEAFPHPEFVDLRLLDVKVKPFSLMGERVEIPRLHVELEKITIVTTKEGVSNAQLFKARVDEATGTDSTSDEPTKPFLIGDLVVRLGSIETVDYSKGDTPVTRTFPLNVDRHFTDVSDPKTVAGPIVADILAANVAGLSTDLAALLPEGSRGAFAEALQSAAPLLRDASGILGEEGQKAAEGLKKLFDSFKDRP